MSQVSIVGLGYVGLPLAVTIAKQGHTVSGIDLNAHRVKQVNQGRNYIKDVEDADLHEVVKSRRLRAYNNFKPVAASDLVIIAVPTPLDKNMQPDVEPMVNAAENTARYLRKGTAVVLESTTYPGTTEELLQPILEKSGLKVGRDFYLGFSPERVDPGNKIYKTENTPKIISGVTRQCLQRIKKIYDTFIARTVPVSTPRVAEMAKLLENIFRNVNIALVNEIMLLCDRMNIDAWEVIDAAATKPFGFMKFLPGPGVGGHCIPIDPFYLSYKAKEYNFFTNFIDLSAEVNENIPYFVVNKLLRLLATRGLTPRKTSLLVLGLAFKKDVDDFRNSPSIKVVELLQPYGFKLMVNDPGVDTITISKRKFTSVKDPYRAATTADCCLILTDHSIYHWSKLVSSARGFILDTRNATKGMKSRKIIKL